MKCAVTLLMLRSNRILLGPLDVSDDTRATLIQHAHQRGDLTLAGHQPGDEAEQRVGELLGMMASTREYQLA